MPNVGAVVHIDPLITLQPPHKLPIADINRNDLNRSTAEKDIGETPGRRAGVEAPLARDGQALRLESFECTEEFVRSA
ncbi:hypothetical protein GOACH_35_00290 [Gordonia aichiensis NBRC 108223]|uniref:Uncharacterized protein n=1 Tax=Gordonia aichiensis NBRC 108223 TaxID=1220583 RepID=L7KSS3_9ACTN|nr:hypothetical protein GOACH_35_00290 [Gordonia aichiensis NBRC 108223]